METPENIIKRTTRDIFEGIKKGHTPLTLETHLDHFFKDENYYIVDETGRHLRFSFKKEDIVNSLRENNNDLKEAFHELIKLGEEREKEAKIKGEINRLKHTEERRMIREEAEKRLYGKVEENKRAAISEKDKEIIFSKFNNECAICSRKEGLHIHHKDHNPSNNRMDNLIVLCGVCHKKIHMKVR